MNNAVSNNPAHHRYELKVDGHIAATYYKIADAPPCLYRELLHRGQRLSMMAIGRLAIRQAAIIESRPTNLRLQRWSLRLAQFD
jgi:hypothetical protein